MEEYAWVRGVEDRHTRARVDLAVEHRKRGLRFIAEAKQRHPDLARSRPKTITNSIARGLSEAWRQLDGVPKDGWDRVAAVFLSPRVNKPTYVKAATQEFTALLRSLPHSAVWAFPDWARRMRSEVNGDLYPGAALIIDYRAARNRRARR